MPRCFALPSLFALALSACTGGSIAFVGTCPDGGLDVDCGVNSSSAVLTLTPGSTGNWTLQLRAEGSSAGTYDFSVAPANAALLTASVLPTSAEVKSGVLQPVEVSIVAAANAPATPSTSVYVTATPKGGSEKDGAGQIVRVKIAAP